MKYALHFEPLLSPLWLLILALAALAPVALAFWLRRSGAWLRLAACGFFALALLNPVMLEQQRQPQTAIVALVADNSQSQNFGARRQDTAAALAALRQKLAAYPQFEPRIVQAARQNSGGDSPNDTSTLLFAAVRDALADVPPARIGGVVLLTDGQVADIPAQAAALGFNAPVNALISGSPQEYDRRIRFVQAPRFGLAGKTAPFSFMVQDEGAMPAGHSPAEVELFVNGESQARYSVLPGAETQAEITLPHSGGNIIELSTPPLPGELTAMNNRAAALIDGVRENLKVLLVSGEPHNGLRTWRDLLKSDTGVDLVHFTILRPPEKQDNTPINELSLIVFPTTELFVNKLKDFDLVIFDRYQHYDVLPLIYYDYMARYVENGGALLAAVGPEFAGGKSPALTPLSRILPARPTGNIFEKPYLPRLTPAGKRHPVTQNLEGGQTEPPQWGQWLRQIEAEPDEDSAVLMRGVNNAPLMLLAHKGKGRVGMLLSDEGWLWARGYQGGGPYAALYRRMAHWLMKEPELEEESLTAAAKGRVITIERRSISEQPAKAAKPAAAADEAAAVQSPIGLFRILLPSGKTLTLVPKRQTDGLYTARFTSPEIGLVRIENGAKSALVHAGAPDQPEFADSISTAAKLAPIAAATGGAVLRMHKTADDALHIGGIKAVGAADTGRHGAGDSLTLQTSRDSRLITEQRLPLFASFWAMAAGLGLLALTWRRESRS